MQEKLICVLRKDTRELDNYLKEGWSIKQISACGNYVLNYCYVHLIKENRNLSNSQ